MTNATPASTNPIKSKTTQPNELSRKPSPCNNAFIFFTSDEKRVVKSHSIKMI